MFTGKERREKLEAEKQRLIENENKPNHFSEGKLKGSDILAIIISATLVFGPVLLICIALMFFVFLSL